MSTDRELLEMAAKAEGHKVEFDELSGLNWYDTKYTGLLWDPFHVDGDALRLAVKLRMDISVHISHVTVEASSSDGESRITIREKIGGANETAEEATRRAIVRAAAEIGRNMP